MVIKSRAIQGFHSAAIHTLTFSLLRQRGGPMFVYLLIGAELAVLYTAFWYLYLREPKYNHRISSSLWGSYEKLSASDDLDPRIGWLKPGKLVTPSDKKPDKQTEYVLDQATNRYIPVADSGGLITYFARKLDRAFSKLNVRP